jgi:hypothetical protein
MANLLGIITAICLIGIGVVFVTAVTFFVVYVFTVLKEIKKGDL